MTAGRLRLRRPGGSALVCRTITGDHGHSGPATAIICTALGMGEAHHRSGGRHHPPRSLYAAACCSVLKGQTRLVATTWEWADEIDVPRAEAARARAEEQLARKDLDDRELELAKARLRRALVRTSVAK